MSYTSEKIHDIIISNEKTLKSLRETIDEKRKELEERHKRDQKEIESLKQEISDLRAELGDVEFKQGKLYPQITSIAVGDNIDIDSIPAKSTKIVEQPNGTVATIYCGFSQNTKVAVDFQGEDTPSVDFAIKVPGLT